MVHGVFVRSIVIVIGPSLVSMTAATLPVAGTLAPFGGSTGLAGVVLAVYVQFTVPGDAEATTTLPVDFAEVAPGAAAVVDAHPAMRAAPTRRTRALRITGSDCHTWPDTTRRTCRGGRDRDR